MISLAWPERIDCGRAGALENGRKTSVSHGEIDADRRQPPTPAAYCGAASLRGRGGDCPRRASRHQRHPRFPHRRALLHRFRLAPRIRICRLSADSPVARASGDRSPGSHAMGPPPASDPARRVHGCSLRRVRAAPWRLSPPAGPRPIDRRHGALVPRRKLGLSDRDVR